MNTGMNLPLPPSRLIQISLPRFQSSSLLPLFLHITARHGQDGLVSGRPDSFKAGWGETRGGLQPSGQAE